MSPTEQAERFRRWLLGEMRRQGISQRQLAGKLGRSRPGVSLIVHGHQRLTLELAIAWAAALGYTLDNAFYASRLPS